MLRISQTPLKMSLCSSLYDLDLILILHEHHHHSRESVHNHQQDTQLFRILAPSEYQHSFIRIGGNKLITYAAVAVKISTLEVAASVRNMSPMAKMAVKTAMTPSKSAVW